jgi:hypothetical protein
MPAVSLFYFAAMAFVLGFVHLALKVASNKSAEISGPWFFLGMLAAWSGSALFTQQRRLQALEDEVAQLRKRRTAEPDVAADSGCDPGIPAP